ncbi:MAG: hypothetical protein LUH18_07015 [Oscillospiraceae bacterium]|nr:hypothetical protein [Oscillospiraceae bacterium]
MLDERGFHYILTEDILCEFANLVFSEYEITERAVISVTRNADIYKPHFTLYLNKNEKIIPQIEKQGAPSSTASRASRSTRKSV